MTPRLAAIGIVFIAPALAAQVRLTPCRSRWRRSVQNTIGGRSKKAGDPPTPVGTGGVMTPQGNRWMAQNATVRTLVRFAYGSDGDLSTPALLEDFRVVGGSSWIASEAYDVVAKMPDTPRATGNSALMLRTLLADRCALRLHPEIRELPVYALVRARTDGTPGDQMRRTFGACVPRSERTGRDQVPCGVRAGYAGLMGEGVSMGQLTYASSPVVSRPVVDRNGPRRSIRFPTAILSGRRRRRPSVSLDLHGPAGAARAAAGVHPGTGSGARDRQRPASHGQLRSVLSQHVVRIEP